MCSPKKSRRKKPQKRFIDTAIEVFFSGPGGEFHHRPNSGPSQQLVIISLSLLNPLTSLNMAIFVICSLQFIICFNMAVNIDFAYHRESGTIFRLLSEFFPKFVSFQALQQPNHQTPHLYPSSSFPMGQFSKQRNLTLSFVFFCHGSEFIHSLFLLWWEKQVSLCFALGRTLKHIWAWITVM